MTHSILAATIRDSARAMPQKQLRRIVAAAGDFKLLVQLPAAQRYESAA